MKEWIWLNMIPVLPKETNRLLFKFGSPSKILEAPLKKLVEVGGIDNDSAERFIRYRDEQEKKLEKELKLINSAGIKIITIESSNYPDSLKQIFDPPIVLYVLGEIKKEDELSIAIVGSRKASSYGKIVADKLAKDLARLKIPVISGMARGIDSVAHESCLEEGGRTVAILGSGLNVVYPPENKNLMKRIIKNGAVVSEFPMNTQPDRYNFPRRNRIISGLSAGTLVVEAPLESGALITANFALEQGKQVFAIPGNINSPVSKGTNKLIKDGAKLVEDVEDILEEIHEFASFRTASLNKQESLLVESLSSQEKLVVACLSHEPEHIDVLTRRSGLPISQLSTVLMELELKGFIKQLAGKLFIKENA